jgi:GT2 family glycosyltransferase
MSRTPIFAHPAVPGRFSVVIPNWNGLRFLDVCLRALEQQTYPDIEVILADNASADGSTAFVRAHFPAVRVLDMGRNAGFTGACNAGMQAATGEFIALLNNDTEVEHGWAAAVVTAFRAHGESIGSVASKMLLFDRRDTIHTTGDYFTTDGRAGNRGVWERDTGQYDRAEDVFSACGGSAVYRRVMLEHIGLLDDAFFFSGEDVDLGWRAQLAGWRCLYTPDAIVYHHLSATGGGVTASYYDGRNLIFILVRNVPAGLWRRYGHRIIAAQARLAWEAVCAWRGAAARARLRGMAAGLFALPMLLAGRKRIQAARTISDAALEKRLTPA